MSSFKYTTAYWRDSQEIFEQGTKAYTSTDFYILNYNAVRANINIHFFDMKGNLYADMEVSLMTEANEVLDLRITDIMAIKNANYPVTTSLRRGSMRIVSDVPLVVSGKMYSGTSAGGEVYIDSVWSIPFEEIQLPDVELHGIAEPTIPNKDWRQFFKRRRDL